MLSNFLLFKTMLQYCFSQKSAYIKDAFYSNIQSLVTILGILSWYRFGPYFVFSIASVLLNIHSTIFLKYSFEIYVHAFIRHPTILDWLAAHPRFECSFSSHSKSARWDRDPMGGHFNTKNSSPCSMNQSDTIFVLWHGTVSPWKGPPDNGYSVY